MAPVFLLCFTDSVHGSTEQQVGIGKLQSLSPCLPVELQYFHLRCSEALSSRETFIAEQKKVSAELSPLQVLRRPPRQLNLQKGLHYTTKSLISNCYTLKEALNTEQ